MKLMFRSAPVITNINTVKPEQLSITFNVIHGVYVNSVLLFMVGGTSNAKV